MSELPIGCRRSHPHPEPCELLVEQVLMRRGGVLWGLRVVRTVPGERGGLIVEVAFPPQAGADGE